MDEIKVAIIGGSGFYRMEGIADPEYREIDTPFGHPSEKILTGSLEGKPIAFLSRHGLGHRINPSQVNYRANLFALWELGVRFLISVTAVGSLREDLHPTDLVIPDQYFDATCKREKTFFENGVAVHVSMARPTCTPFSTLALQQARELGIQTHLGGTYYNMEGPQFSSIAESEAYRKMGFSIIGMTQAVEAKLARELEMCFCPLAFVTDYDCWHPADDEVSVDMVVRNLNKNTTHARKLIGAIVRHLDLKGFSCNCRQALQNALITDPDRLTPQVIRRLGPVLKKYLNHD